MSRLHGLDVILINTGSIDQPPQPVEAADGLGDVLYSPFEADQVKATVTARLAMQARAALKNA